MARLFQHFTSENDTPRLGTVRGQFECHRELALEKGRDSQIQIRLFPPFLSTYLNTLDLVAADPNPKRGEGRRITASRLRRLLRRRL